MVTPVSLLSPQETIDNLKDLRNLSILVILVFQIRKLKLRGIE